MSLHNTANEKSPRDLVELGRQVATILKLKYSKKEDKYSTNYGSKTTLGLGKMTANIIEEYGHSQKKGSSLSDAEAIALGNEVIERFGLEMRKNGNVSTTWAEATAEGIGRMILNIQETVLSSIHEIPVNENMDLEKEKASLNQRVSQDSQTQDYN